MTPANGHSHYSFMDRVWLLFGHTKAREVFDVPTNGGPRRPSGSAVSVAVAAPADRATDADHGLNMDVAQILSPSQVGMFLNCAAAWMFRYLLDLPDKTDAKRALGKAVDRVLSLNFARKISTKRDMERELKNVK